MTAEEWAVSAIATWNVKEMSAHSVHRTLKAYIAEAVRGAVAEAEDRVLATSRARFHANALLAGTWEFEALEAAREAGRAEESPPIVAFDSEAWKEQRARLEVLAKLSPKDGAIRAALNQIDGLQKSENLLLKGMERQAELMDGLKQEVRKLKAQLDAAEIREGSTP